MGKRKLYKFSGAGNDFVVLDGRRADVSAFREPRRIGELCREYRTDGLMILGKAKGYDFAMEFFNPDGSGGMMCGNGGRCIVAFADYLGLKPAAADGVWRFLAPDGPHEAQILSGPGRQAPEDVCTTAHGQGEGPDGYKFPKGTQETLGGAEGAQRLSPSGGSLSSPWVVRLKMIDVEGIKPMMGGYFLNTGTRHFVKFVRSVEAVDMEKDGPEYRWDEAFQPEGTNANFVEARPDGLHIRTFEKGVEAETLACGTGITASAIAACEAGIPGVDGASTGAEGCTSYRLQCLRGDWLQVDFKKDGGRFTNVYLTGPAELVRFAYLTDNE